MQEEDRLKRVLVVAYLFPPVGGAGVQRIAKFVKYLPEFGWQPTVLTAANPSVPLKDESLLDEIPAEVRIEVARTFEPGYALKQAVSGSQEKSGHGSRRILPGLKRLVRACGNTVLQPDPQILWYPNAVRTGLRLLKETPHDAIFVTAPPFSSFLVGATLSRRSGLPLLLDYRDEWGISNTYWENKQHGRLSRAVQSSMQRYVVRSANALIATTRASAGSLYHVAAQTRRIPVITHLYNGYDAQDFASPAGTPADESQSGRYRLVYTGTLWNLTSVEPLVKAIQTLSERSPRLAERLDFVIAGRRTTQQDRLLQELDGLPCRLVRHDYVDHAAAVSLMRSADGLCLLLSDVPHADRVVPAKLFEYMAAQRPIVFIGPEGEVSGLLQDCPYARVCSPGNIDRIVQTLANEIESSPQAGPVDKNVADWSPERFERRSLTGQLAELLDAVMPREAPIQNNSPFDDTVRSGFSTEYSVPGTQSPASSAPSVAIGDSPQGGIS